mmetsp:Transcript_24158/g.48939  ORF Transcript_24158/g.48939 Transcript_24158/m.48939 type:complete len:248 (-) Transcript_24158:302-1045(-)
MQHTHKFCSSFGSNSSFSPHIFPLLLFFHVSYCLCNDPSHLRPPPNTWLNSLLVIPRILWVKSFIKFYLSHRHVRKFGRHSLCHPIPNAPYDPLHGIRVVVVPDDAERRVRPTRPPLAGIVQGAHQDPAGTTIPTLRSFSLGHHAAQVPLGPGCEPPRETPKSGPVEGGQPPVGGEAGDEGHLGDHPHGRLQRDVVPAHGYRQVVVGRHGPPDEVVLPVRAPVPPLPHGRLLHGAVERRVRHSHALK